MEDQEANPVDMLRQNQVNDNEIRKDESNSTCQDDSNKTRTDDNTDTRKNGTWQHWSLRRSTFIAFAVTIVVLIVTLGILNIYSSHNNGICSANEKAHYAWNYLPTAVFTLLAFLWSSTDFYAKQMQPWECMAEGPQPAAHSVLLEYVSPMNIVVLVNACYRRHYLSALAVGVTLCLQLAITLSTGLFYLDMRDLSNPYVQLNSTERFLMNEGNWYPSSSDTVPWTTVLSFQKYGLSPPQGTTFDSAFQSFTPPEMLGPHVVSATAVVEVFTSALNCQELTYASSHSDPTMSKATARTCLTGVNTYLEDLEMNVKPGWAAWIGYGSCEANVAWPEALIIGVSSKTTTSGQANNTANTTALFCEATYKVESQPVTLHRHSRVEIGAGAANSTRRTIPGVGVGKLVGQFYDSLLNNWPTKPTRPKHGEYSNFVWNP